MGFEVPDLERLEASSWSVTLDHPRGVQTKGFRAFARGIDPPWATFGVVGDGGSLSMPIGQGPFLFGFVTKDKPYTRLAGIVSQADTYLRIPTGSLALLSDGPIDEARYIVSIVDVDGPAWPRELLPLRVGSADAIGGARECRVEDLFPGTYEVRITRIEDGVEQVRRIEVEVRSETSISRATWPFHP